MDEIKGMLDEEIRDRIETVSDLPQGSAESAKAVEELSQLHKLRIEEMRVEAEVAEKHRQYELDRKAKEDELALKKAQRKDQFITALITAGVTVGTTVITLIVNDSWYKRGLKFEETGTVCSSFNKGLMSRMFSKR